MSLFKKIMDRKKDFVSKHLVKPNYILVDVDFFLEFESELTDRMVYIIDENDYPRDVIQNMKILKVPGLGCDFKLIADIQADL